VLSEHQSPLPDHKQEPSATDLPAGCLCSALLTGRLATQPRRPRRPVARLPSPPASLLQGACRVRAAHPREYMAGPITALCRSPAALIAPAWSRSCGLEQKKTENGNYGREFVKCESKAQPGKVCARFVDFGLPFISFCRFHVILA